MRVPSTNVRRMFPSASKPAYRVDETAAREPCTRDAAQSATNAAQAVRSSFAAGLLTAESTMAIHYTRGHRAAVSGAGWEQLLDVADEDVLDVEVLVDPE